MPTGIASKIHMMQAHATTASVALPATDKPSGAGISHRIKKNANQARKNPRMDLPGERPEAMILSRNRPKNPVCVVSLISSTPQFFIIGD